MVISAPTSEYSVPLSAAVDVSGYSERHLRRLVDSGHLSAAKLRGRLLFTAAGLEGLTTPQRAEHEADRIIADLIATAPRFSEAQRSRIAAVFTSTAPSPALPGVTAAMAVAAGEGVGA
ncbi:hypothetical protein [Salinibacterium sp. SWN167]|uniref:hypothetical protein n=1 Tax=Salinibacterium sp. SWN167 TaxID=2792054 RepID=UPI0018CFAC15|nr:hypothetical protein [Salinibacterium sp. SWN167]MBH0083010.1 hypothetical protein [Salinibacterium sp. SWN167]